jgi:hypothetical protein
MPWRGTLTEYHAFFHKGMMVTLPSLSSISNPLYGMNIDHRHQLCEQFLGWQCRIRQHSVRKQQGKPPPGIRASVKLDGEFTSQINTVIIKREPRDVISEFRFMVQKTVDPQKIYENAIKYLSEYYYQFPKEFDHRFTALFSVDSELADRIVAANDCQLGFYQGNQRYTLNCGAQCLDPSSDEYQATYWHNHLFNPSLPGVVKVVGFEPDWENSLAEQTRTAENAL